MSCWGRFHLQEWLSTSGLSDVELIDIPGNHLGQFHYCVLHGNGTVSCWGVNYGGRLDLGATMRLSTSRGRFRGSPAPSRSPSGSATPVSCTGAVTFRAGEGDPTARSATGKARKSPAPSASPDCRPCASPRVCWRRWEPLSPVEVWEDVPIACQVLIRGRGRDLVRCSV